MQSTCRQSPLASSHEREYRGPPYDSRDVSDPNGLLRVAIMIGQMLVRHGGVTPETSALMADASTWLNGGIASPQLLAVTATVDDMDSSTTECGARSAVIAAGGAVMFGHVGWWVRITQKVARDLGMLCEAYPWEPVCHGSIRMRL